LQKSLKAHIEYLLCVHIFDIRPVSGGDISEAYILQTESEQFFCKVNYSAQAYDMFLTEKAGLEAIGKSGTLAAPNILFCEPLEKGAVLILEYIPSKPSSPKDMELFGHQLAALHQYSEADNFGWQTDNFIGSLPQQNKSHSHWADFYVSERLLPQLRLAIDQRLLRKQEIPSQMHILSRCESLFPKTKPALLHGDLWSGNYMISSEGTPYVVDPASYYGHHEVDMAMTRLFGGFGSSFYGAYREHYPRAPFEDERTEIYQLYYLLVHLNLFGRSYYSSVESILKRYF